MRQFNTNDPASATIVAGTITSAVMPYILSALSVIIAAALTFLASAAHRYVGVTIQDTTIKEADTYLLGLAKKAVAAATDNLATAQINVHSPLVKALVNEAVQYGPEVLTKLGWGPDQIASKLASAFGGLQASMTRVDPMPPMKNAAGASSTAPATTQSVSGPAPRP